MQSWWSSRELPPSKVLLLWLLVAVGATAAATGLASINRDPTWFGIVPSIALIGSGIGGLFYAIIELRRYMRSHTSEPGTPLRHQRRGGLWDGTANDEETTSAYPRSFRRYGLTAIGIYSVVSVVLVVEAILTEQAIYWVLAVALIVGVGFTAFATLFSDRQ
jgi:hypothetical protein